MTAPTKWTLTREKWGRSFRKRRLKVARWLLKQPWVLEPIAQQLAPVAPSPEILPPAAPASAQQAIEPQAFVSRAVEPQAIMTPYDTGSALKPGVCIVGYLRSEIGLGQAARCLAHASDAARLPASFHHLSLPSRENEPEFATKCIPVPDRVANLLVYGLPSITTLHGEIRGGRHNILYPFWELGGIEPEWLHYANRCAEVWAPSTFVASAFREHSKMPVTLVRQPVCFPALASEPRKPSKPLTFLTYFDFDSYGERKNPKATIQAFRAAFPQGSEDARLIIKTRGHDDRGLRNWLAEQCGADSRLEFIDRTIERSEIWRLLADCDAFVSLHRSEGFGFGAAEALAARKAVIATDYSGTTDFISNATGYPVSYKLIPVGDGNYPSAAGNVWADAEIDDAAAAMRSIYDHPADASKKADAGYRHLTAEFSPAIIGQQMRALLGERGLI